MKSFLEFRNSPLMLREFIDNDMISLMKYINMSDKEQMESLPYHFSWLYQDYMTHIGEIPTGDYLDNPDEVITNLKKEHPDWFRGFVNYILKKIDRNEIEHIDKPAWMFFDKAEIVKNQWLIHFTNDAEDVAMKGFKYGIDDIGKLGLTVYQSDEEKKYGGYNFAYLLKDFEKYGRSKHSYRDLRYKYGREAVVFRASGIKTWHYGDEEPQVVFRGSRTTDRIPIITSETGYGILDKKKHGLFIHEEETMEEMVKWIVDNYEQYRGRISYE
jgi:hypothetical protein